VKSESDYFSRSNVWPHLERALRRPQSKKVALTEGHRPNNFGVAFQLFDQTPCVCIPDANCFVEACGQQVPLVEGTKA